MIKPPYLQPGDTLGIVAPGRKVTEQQVADAANMFRSWGLRVVYAPNLFTNDHSYLAATDEHRLHDLQQMLDDHSVRAIVSARGGYGTTRILESLDFSAMLANPKWVVGFSDVTALHLKLYTLGIESLHATMPILFSKSDSGTSIESIKRALFGAPVNISAEGHKQNRSGVATGRIVGGNLSLIVDALGTPSDPDLRGCILMIEDIDEYDYKVDRMLTQLKRAGKLRSLAGLVVGHMTDIKECGLSFGETVAQLVLHAMDETAVPVAFNFPSGHENPNLAWYHGRQATLTASTSGSVLIQAAGA